MIRSASIILLLWVAWIPGRPMGQPAAEAGWQQSKEDFMSGTQNDAAGSAEGEQTTRLERARAAARGFCRHFEFPPEYINQLDGNPIQKPLVIERNGSQVEVFRWLGHGRGAPYVQVELGNKTDEITVYGAFKDREFGPWKP